MDNSERIAKHYITNQDISGLARLFEDTNKTANELLDRIAALEAENAELKRQLTEAREAVGDLLDGLDANTDERCGLTPKQWVDRIARAWLVVHPKA
jgi:hypothetical protein